MSNAFCAVSMFSLIPDDTIDLSNIMLGQSRVDLEACTKIVTVMLKRMGKLLAIGYTHPKVCDEMYSRKSAESSQMRIWKVEESFSDLLSLTKQGVDWRRVSSK